MASALSALANASATFTVPATGVVTDPETGNVTAATNTVTVSLFLKAEKISTTALPGIDVVDTLYEGYAVDPVAFDNGVVVGTEGVLTFGTADPIECEVTALRLPYGDTGLLGVTLNAALGERVQLLARGQR
jgi:hypothetical protein